MASVQIAVTFSVAGPLLARMADELATNAAEVYLVKMMIGVVGLAMVVGGPLAGFLTDRLGRRPVLVGAGLLFAIAGMAPALLDNLPVILVTRFLVGLAAAATATTGAAMIGDYFSEGERAKWTGALVSVSMVVGLLTTPVAGLLGDISWRLPFALHAMGLIIAAVGWFGLRGADERPPAAAMPDAARRGSFGGLPLGLLGLAFLIGILSYTPAIYVAFRLQELGVGNPSSVGWGLMLNAIAGAIVASQFGRASRAGSSRALFAISFGGMATGLAMLALAQSFALVMAGMFVVGLGLAWLTPNLLTVTITAVDDSRRGRAVGFVRGAQAIAPAIGITALQPLENAVGISGVLLTMAGLGLALCIAMASAGFTSRRRAISPTQPH